MRKHSVVGSLFILLFLILFAVTHSSTSADDTIPVTLTLFRLVEIDDPDSGKIGSVAGDYYARVQINGSGFNNSSTVSIDPDFGEGVIYTTPVTFNPFWTFTENVDATLDSVVIEIEIYDEDNPGFPLFDDDDHIDVNPDSGQKDVTLEVDLTTGDWSGDVPLNQTFSAGGGGDGDRARIFFGVSILSADGDADGDGLLDSWETHGLDGNGDGTIDVDLPAFGADPNHKDIFLELDWMPSNAPTRSQIQAMKTAFANAPSNAGTNASTLCNPDCGLDAKVNPDGQPGINLWVDTGGLTVVAAGEGGSGPASCTDGNDNDGDGAMDNADPDCIDSEDGAGLNSCTDGLDNGGDGLVDAADPDCLVGDNFGGGNQVNLAAVPNLNAAFYAIKNSPGNNFNANRSFIFRYGISAVPGLEDGSGLANSCFDGIDNGGGDENGDGVPEIDGNDPDCQFGGGWGEVGGNDFIEYNHDGGSIMHELGHTLNLRHGGNGTNNCKANYVSVMNYYHQFGINQAGGGFILDYSPPRFAGGRGNAPISNLVENNLSETAILDASDSVNRFVFRQYQLLNSSEDGATANSCNDGVDNNGDGLTDRGDPACYIPVQWPLNGADIDGDSTIDGVDWNGDRALGATVTANINSSGNLSALNFRPPPAAPVAPNFRPTACTNNTSTDSLTGFNDWLTLSIPFRHFGDSADGAMNPTTEPEPTLQELLNLQTALHTTDIGIEKSDIPTTLAAVIQSSSFFPYKIYTPVVANGTETADPSALPAQLDSIAIAGTELVYVLDISNNGPNPGSEIEVVDSLPAGVTYLSDDGGCVESPASTLTCSLGELLFNESRQIMITTFIAPDLVYAAGGPTTITNESSVENLAGTDSNLVNNSAAVDTDVVAVADLEIVNFEALNPPTQILVGEPVPITVRTTLTNHGPSGPMDVTLASTTTAPLDATIDPAATSQVITALDLDEMRVVEETYMVQCNGYSHHNFTFATEVQPLQAEDSDPYLANNQADLSLDIECVVPVAIDIIPKQINLNGQGVVPVLVLNNESGEYDLPLGFDASTIDPLSVRFGPEQVVWSDTGGAAESHDKGHGHGQGLLFHFIASESGLTPNDTEGCLKGTWFDEDNNPHSFFGCDEVIVK